MQLKRHKRSLGLCLLLLGVAVGLFLSGCLKAEAIAQDCSGGGSDCLTGYAALEATFRSSTPNYPVIFLTTSAYDGIQVGSEANADSLCMGQIPSGVSGTFKAMLASTNTGVAVRRASQTANAGDGQLDWVLKPNQSYMRPDGTVIGTTNSSALFSFPLQASFGSSSGNFWTGLQSDWRTASVPCDDGNGTSWGDNTTGSSANVGDASVTGSASIAGATHSCDMTNVLLCVEQ